MIICLVLLAGLLSKAPAPAVIVIKQPTEMLISSGLARYDLPGSAFQPGSVVTHSFRLRNITLKPLIIQRFQPSCRCTQGQILKSNQPVPLPFTLKPGQEVQVRMSVNTKILKPGPFDKYLSVFVAGEKWPSVTLEIKGNLAQKSEIGIQANGTSRALK